MTASLSGAPAGALPLPLGAFCRRRRRCALLMIAGLGLALVGFAFSTAAALRTLHGDLPHIAACFVRVRRKCTRGADSGKGSRKRAVLMRV